MKYGDGYFCVRDGVRLPHRIYPATQATDYNDGTGETCDMLVRDWCVDVKLPDWDCWVRFTVKGDPEPVIYKNAFDFDFASIYTKLLRLISCDKADYRIRSGSLLHDILFCVVLEEFGLATTNRLLYEIMEAYNREDIAETGNWLNRKRIAALNAIRHAEDKALRLKVYAGVGVGGRFIWGKKTPEEIAMYRSMLTVERIGV